MQSQNLDFVALPMSEAARLRSRHRQCDGDITRAARSGSREGKHVGDFIVIAELAIQTSHLRARGEQNAHLALKADEPLRAPCEPCRAQRKRGAWSFFRMAGFRSCSFHKKGGQQAALPRSSSF